MAAEPYRDTSVPVERSKTQIRDALTKASTFGFLRFEEIFLAHFEDPSSGRTIGEALIPELQIGRLALPAGSAA